MVNYFFSSSPIKKRPIDVVRDADEEAMPAVVAEARVVVPSTTPSPAPCTPSARLQAKLSQRSAKKPKVNQLVLFIPHFF